MAEETKKTVLKPGERIVNLKDKVVMIAAKDAKHHKPGSEFECHPEVAKFLVKTKQADYKDGEDAVIKKDDGKKKKK